MNTKQPYAYEEGFPCKACILGLLNGVHVHSIHNLCEGKQELPIGDET